MAAGEGGFCTAVNCMDGRVQLPVNAYMQQRFSVAYVDAVTEAGPIAILARQDEPLIASILSRVRISVEKHGSRVIAVVGHHDCAGNPVSKDLQIVQCRAAADLLAESFPQALVVKLWVDETWQVHDIDGE